MPLAKYLEIWVWEVDLRVQTASLLSWSLSYFKESLKVATFAKSEFWTITYCYCFRSSVLNNRTPNLHSAISSKCGFFHPFIESVTMKGFCVLCSCLRNLEPLLLPWEPSMWNWLRQVLKYICELWKCKITALILVSYTSRWWFVKIQFLYCKGQWINSTVQTSSLEWLLESSQPLPIYFVYVYNLEWLSPLSGILKLNENRLLALILLGDCTYVLASDDVTESVKCS